MKTTDIWALQHGERFSWGEIITIHHIGEYSLVEFHPWVYINCCGTDQINEAETEFSCYINGYSISRSAESLDSALATCIAHKHDGGNSQAAVYFMKMIGKESK